MAVGDDEEILQQLDGTKPTKATQNKSVLDNYQRGLRRSFINSFGHEHHLTGEHKFGYGNLTERSSHVQLAGAVEGQVWARTDNVGGELERYTIANGWRRIQSYQPQSISLLSGIAHPTLTVTDGFYVIFAANAPFVARVAAGATGNLIVLTVPVWFWKGVYDLRGSVSIRKFGTGNDPTPVSAQIQVGSIGTVTVMTGATATSTDTWYDSATPVSEATVSADGWQLVQVKLNATIVALGATGVILSGANLYYEPVDLS